MYQVIAYWKRNCYTIFLETSNYDEAKSFFDKIEPAERLAGEGINTYELVEVKGNELIGIAIKQDTIISLDRI